MSGLPHNNDFLSQGNSKIEEYKEYYALTPYQRKCLAATNYFHVLYGNKNKITEVPPSDKEYHKYFDKRCYDRAEAYQKQKK